jgi:hypothetical protein
MEMVWSEIIHLRLSPCAVKKNKATTFGCCLTLG